MFRCTTAQQAYRSCHSQDPTSLCGPPCQAKKRLQHPQPLMFVFIQPYLLHRLDATSKPQNSWNSRTSCPNMRMHMCVARTTLVCAKVWSIQLTFSQMQHLIAGLPIAMLLRIAISLKSRQKHSFVNASSSQQQDPGPSQ